MPKKNNIEKFNLNGIECKAKCVDVYDGDTITLEIDFRELIKKYYNEDKNSIIDQLPYRSINLNCRMAGYNSAEVSRCSKEEKEIGLKAKDYMMGLVLDKELWCHFLDLGQGNLVQLKNEDPYKRPIIDLFLLNEGKKGEYINEKMIKSGHAAPYDGHGTKKY